MFYSSDEPLELKGKLAPNAVLDKAQPMKLDLEIEGPESIAISPKGNDIYTGIVGGEIVRINENGKVTIVTKFGQDCGMIPFDSAMIEFCTSRVSCIFRRRMGNTQMRQSCRFTI